MGASVSVLHDSQSCFRTYRRSAFDSPCNLGSGGQRRRSGHCTRFLQLCGPHCSAPQGELCPSVSWEHRKYLSGGPHKRLATGQWFFSNAFVCLHSEPPRRVVRGSLRPLGPAARALFHPMKTASVLPSLKLNRVHSPSSAPFISKDSRAHNTLYSLVLCHWTIKGLLLACFLETPPPLLCSCRQLFWTVQSTAPNSRLFRMSHAEDSSLRSTAPSYNVWIFAKHTQQTKTNLPTNLKKTSLKPLKWCCFVLQWRWKFGPCPFLFSSKPPLYNKQIEVV